MDDVLATFRHCALAIEMQPTVQSRKKASRCTRLQSDKLVTGIFRRNMSLGWKLEIRANEELGFEKLLSESP